MDSWCHFFLVLLFIATYRRKVEDTAYGYGAGPHEQWAVTNNGQ